MAVNRTDVMRSVVDGVVDDLALRPPFLIGEVLQAIAVRWQVVVDLFPFTGRDPEIAAGITGWCQFAGDRFQVHYYAGGSTAQQEHIIYHEIGHLVFNHVAPGQSGVLHRCDGEYVESELHAEAFAEIMAELSVLGADAGGAPARRAEGTDDPYHRFLLAQDL
jgi:hypothetical protein